MEARVAALAVVQITGPDVGDRSEAAFRGLGQRRIASRGADQLEIFVAGLLRCA
jgi:hypothetical protein